MDVIMFFQGFDRPDQSFDPLRPHKRPRDVRGLSVPKAFSFELFAFS